LRLEIELPGYSVWLRAWEVQVGRSKLYLLDSSDLANMPAHRGITAELYGGDACMRLKQEIVLGMGGWRLLRALGLQPEVCHLNEGHAALAILVRARDFMRESGQPFDVALSVTRAGNLFTTHTAVAAGFDRYEPSMFERYLGPWAAEHLGLKPTELLALGRANPRDATESFNMAYLAVRGSGAVNGVSRLHGEVSRRLFAPLFPRWPLGEVPIGHVTNGVHVPTWDSSEADAVWTEACGQGRWLGATETLTGEVRAIPLARLWQMRNAGRKSTIDYALRHLKLSMAVAGATPAEVAATKPPLDPNVLTLGFARRFATYKRPTLLLHDPQRLMRLLTDSRHPAQLLIAGKAHPADLAGQALIHDWTRFIRQQSPAPPVVFLDDYDMLMAEYLVQGVDVWLNTPQRPWEASGTSGMKVLVNGGLNLSELDGWWAEAYAPEVGWALGDGREHGGDPAWDAAEADELYRHLEHEVIPEFYARGADGIPNAWVARIRESMARLTPQFSANRTVREYTEAHYLPAAAAYRARAARQGFWGRSEITWRSALQQHWPHLSLGPLTGRRAGDRQEFELVVHLQGLDPDAVRVELYAESDEEADPVRQEMTPAGGARDAADGSLFHASVPAGRPTKDYTARLIPRFDGLSIPLEADQISWQR
jgi:starch phosphorylase